MDNFDLKKYLVENKATTNSRMLSEAEEVSPEQAAKTAMKYAPKLEKSPAMDKLADKIANDPKMMQQLEKALLNAGIPMNENQDVSDLNLDQADLQKLTLNLAKKAEKVSESLKEEIPGDDDVSGELGLGMLAFVGGGTIAANFSAAIAAAIPALGTAFAGPAVAGALAGVGLFLLARKVYSNVTGK